MKEDVGPALTVVWADPGVATGWSVHRVNIRRLLTMGQVASMDRVWWRIGQFRTAGTSASVDHYLDLCRAVYERSDESDVVVIGCESFTLRMQSTDPALLEPVRFLSVLQDRLRGSGVEVQMQSPSDAKKAITDDRLGLWGVYQPGAEHARDAQRHGLLFLRRYCSDERLRKRVSGE